MSTPADPGADFRPLAEVILDAESAPDVVTALARLLEASSRGVGQLTRGDLGLMTTTALPDFAFACDGDLVLLPRYASCWREVRQAVEARHRAPRLAVGSDAAIRSAIDAILPAQRDLVDGRVVFDNAHQRLAVAALADARIGVITGGPGTGKTTSAAALLAVRRRLDSGLAPTEVLITAPTGKAACRLAEALSRAAGQLPLGEAERLFLRTLRPSTLHQALEWMPAPPERGGPFRRGRDLPLKARIIVVDEASMVDLELMAHLIRALPVEASLWILGDSDQLESVETGGVLAELVERGASGRLPDDVVQHWSARLGAPAQPIHVDGLQVCAAADPLPGLVIGLRYSHRAKEAPWVLELAALVRPGHGGTLAAFLACCTRWQGEGRIRRHERRTSFHDLCRERWSAWREGLAAWSLTNLPIEQDVRQRLGAFQLLCLTNAQVERANRIGCDLLWAGGPHRSQLALPHGCPLLVTVNNRALNLSNGDVGIALGQGPGHAAEVAVFPGRTVPIPLIQLPRHQPAFGLTVHKSQGSEWRHVAIDLPGDPGELAELNLVYTAITRSSGAVDLCLASPAAWEAVFASPVRPPATSR